MNPIQDSRQALSMVLVLGMSFATFCAVISTKGVALPSHTSVPADGESRGSSEELFRFSTAGIRFSEAARSSPEDHGDSISVTAEIRSIRDVAGLQAFESALDQAVKQWGFSPRLAALGRRLARIEYESNTATRAQIQVGSSSLERSEVVR